MLDKHEGRYWNRTYLSLPLLELLLDAPDDSEGAPDANRMAMLLIADVIRFETRESDESVDRDPPDPVTLRKRLRHALRFVAHDLGVPGADDLVSPAGHVPWSRWAEVADRLPGPPARRRPTGST